MGGVLHSKTAMPVRAPDNPSVLRARRAPRHALLRESGRNGPVRCLWLRIHSRLKLIALKTHKLQALQRAPP